MALSTDSVQLSPVDFYHYKFTIVYVRNKTLTMTWEKIISTILFYILKNKVFKKLFSNDGIEE